MLASVAQLDVHLTGHQEVVGWQHSFVEVGHEIFTMDILSLWRIQEGHILVVCSKPSLLVERILVVVESSR